MVENSEEPELNDVDIKNLKDKFVHTKDGNLLGIVEFIDKEHLIVKKEVTYPIYYYIPKYKFKKFDEHALWLDISERQATKNHFSTTVYGKINFKTITFRLNKRIMENVRIEAENRIINVNTLVNQILKRFVEMDRFEPISGMIHIPRPVVTEIFNKKSDKEIINMANSIGKNAIYNTILFIKGDRDLNTFLSWIESEMNNHSLNVRHTIDGKIHKYIIKHDLGYKFSLYYKIIIESIFKDSLGESIDFTISDELLLFEFKI
jgi:predicted DNA binding CopG/RHH family protein